MKIEFVATCLLVSMSITVAAQSEPVQRINQLVTEGNYDQALTELSVIEAVDQQPDLLKLQALSYLQLEQYDAAEKAYDALLKQDDGVDVSNNLGLVYLRQARLFDAINVFQSNIRRFPSDSVAYKNLGDIYLSLAELTFKKGVDSADEKEVLSAKLALISSVLEGNQNESSSNPAWVFEGVNKGTAPTNTSHLEREAIIADFLKRWASARSDKQSDDYADFYTPSLLNSEQNILTPTVNIEVLEPAVQFLPGDRASIVFDEWSGPTSQRKRLFKELKLVNGRDGWKITEENTLHSY